MSQLVAYPSRTDIVHPPAVTFHTAPTSARESILAAGLLPSRPGEHRPGTNGSGGFVVDLLLSAQQRGVYVTAEPDVEGRWSSEPAWDVWQVQTPESGWLPDRLHPDSWCLVDQVEATLHGTYGTGA